MPDCRLGRLPYGNLVAQPDHSYIYTRMPEEDLAVTHPTYTIYIYRDHISLYICGRIFHKTYVEIVQHAMHAATPRLTDLPGCATPA